MLPGHGPGTSDASMGLFDRAKELAEEHADKIDDAIEKVADVVDDKTGHKYSDKIDKGADAARGLVDKLGGDDKRPAADDDPPGPR